MHKSGFSVGGLNATDPTGPHGIRLPLVSFILTRRPGEDFGQLIAAIRAQTYPRFEAILVDAVQSPGSETDIAQRVAGDPPFKHVPCDAEASAFERAALGLGAVEGEFVVFFSASELPLPEFAGAHIQVHLASRHNIAFTASRRATTTGPDVIFGSGLVNAAVPPMLPAGPVLRLACLGDDDFARLSARSTLVEPATLDWTISPDATRMYRRSILDLVHPVAGNFVAGPSSPATHYAPLCQLLGGSAAIAMPLSTKLPAPHTADASTGLVGDPPKLAVWAEHGSDFSRRIGPARYWDALSLMLGVAAERLTLAERADLLGGQLARLSKAFGCGQAIYHLDRLLPRPTVLAALRNHHGGRLPLRVHWALQSIAFRQLHEGIRTYLRARRHRRRQKG